MPLRDLVAGMNGEDVGATQKALNTWGATPTLDADGKFGAKTDGIVRNFQDAHHLKHDGIVGGGWAFTLDLATGRAVAGMQFASGITLKLGTTD